MGICPPVSKGSGTTVREMCETAVVVDLLDFQKAGFEGWVDHTSGVEVF